MHAVDREEELGGLGGSSKYTAAPLANANPPPHPALAHAIALARLKSGYRLACFRRVFLKRAKAFGKTHQEQCPLHPRWKEDLGL